MNRHELSAIFPEIEGQEFDELVSSIKENGLRRAITLHEGEILDGWNRYRACRQAGVKPHFEKFPLDEDPVQFVIDENMRRRNLNPSQIAIVGTRFLVYEKARAAERKLAAAKANNDRRQKDAGRAGNVAPTAPLTAAEIAKAAIERRNAARTDGRKWRVDAVLR